MRIPGPRLYVVSCVQELCCLRLRDPRTVVYRLALGEDSSLNFASNAISKSIGQFACGWSLAGLWSAGLLFRTLFLRDLIF